MLIQEVPFRKMYHRIFYISANQNYDKLKENFTYEKEGNGTLVYGYVDHQMGMCFEILALAYRDEEGRIEITAVNEDQTLKSQYETVYECEFAEVPEDLDLSAFSAKTKIVDRFFRYSEDMEKLRDLELLDPYRSEEFPDDVVIYLVGKDRSPEGCWVRCERAEAGMVYGKLLHEPRQYFGVHPGSEIGFCAGDLDGQVILFAEISDIPMLII